MRFPTILFSVKLSQCLAPTSRLNNQENSITPILKAQKTDVVINLY